MISVFDIFKVGIGPSSSHTVGPMKAAEAFARELERRGVLERTAAVTTTLYGSLAFTGHGHAVDKAVILGLSGETPAGIDPDRADAIAARARQDRTLVLAGRHAVAFDPDRHIVFDCLTVPRRHPNTLRFESRDRNGEDLHAETWCSVGGGFIAREDGLDGTTQTAETELPFPFASADELLRQGQENGVSIAGMVWANEVARRSAAEVDAHVQTILAVMFGCIERGLSLDGMLPGGLKVLRRAKAIHEQLRRSSRGNHPPVHEAINWISVYAMAVNEENAAGGRVVTAPTNGAAGVIPAVLRYYRDHCSNADAAGLRTFLLTAAAIGGIFKMNASISGAEVGCQGEVGVACAMAAAGLTAALGGSNEQIENAAEIGMEHNLGLTCDPVGGLVQIPCIERNAFGAVKAVTAASLALQGDGNHRVSLDTVIATMRQTGADMQSKYKETSLGGVAVNYVDC